MGSGVLVDLSVLPEEKPGEHLVIDGIRNLGEIESLRRLFGYKFVLVAIISSFEDRWHRVGPSEYTNRNLSQLDFAADDQRDSNEETAFGQQVQLCIDKADILIDNRARVTLREFREKILSYVDLATGVALRHAKQSEILMNMAYSASASSKCLKRNVGAIVVDAHGSVVAVGYNENPLRTRPCVEEPLYGNRCHRDNVRNQHFALLSERGARCPVCGQQLRPIQGPPWHCDACATEGIKTNLEQFFFPDKAMTWCTAVHAEVWAILAAGERARGGELYTTTHPCFQCAEKIAQAGIRRVCFTEAYPDADSAKRLTMAGVELVQFEGVRSASFERIFARNRPA
jgi:deoxycytidylate deaminase